MTTTTHHRSLTFRELRYDPDDLATLERFYEEVYVPEFPSRDERESLDNMKSYLRLKGNGWYGKNNYHVVLGFADGTAVAGSFADYLDEPNSGVIEFLVVSPTMRGSGFGRRLLDATESRLAADARALGKDALDVVVAEMNDPYKQSKDSLDPFVRASIWAKWGYGLLDFPYIQPALSADKDRVDGLLLIAKPGRSAFEQALPTVKLKAILRGYMRWAMRIDAPAEAPDYQLMTHHLGADAVTIAGLGTYIGHDPSRPFVVHEVTSVADPRLQTALSLYARAFPGGRTDLEPEYFQAALSAPRSDKEERYHFWVVQRDEDAPIEGMGSFFTFRHAGFGGYIALEGSLRRTRRFALLAARVEECMIRDALGAVGWYIECDPRQESLFARHGFYTVDISYAQPPLPGDAPYAPAEAPPLCLMYKPFGRSFAPPSVSVRTFCDTLTRIFGAVYGIENVAQSPFYAHLCKHAERWADGRVRFLRPGG
jgi:GNAT superfamily N-acetyltransferase